VIPRTLFYLYDLRRNLHLKPSELQRLQWKRFRALVKYAYENVPFYHRKFRSAGVKPDDVKGFDDLWKIPAITKFEIQACDLKDMVAGNVDVGSLVKRSTSGSTGVPLNTLVDGRVEDFEAAVRMRALFENGLRVRDKMAVVADPRSFPKKRSVFQRFGVMKRKHISIFDYAEKQMMLLREFKPDVVKGYSSSLFILAEEFNDAAKEIEPRLIFTSAELLDASSRKLVSSAFGAELFDFYACSEFSLLAWECREHCGYHVNADSVLMEFVDDNGGAVAFGERGNVVCTSLFNNVMPIIRYKLDDVAIPIDDKCSCGRTLPLLRLIEGRADDFLVATDGRLISPTVFFPYPFDNMDGIKQFRMVQERKDKLRIELVPNEMLSNDSLFFERAEHRIKQFFGENMNVEFQIVREIKRDPSGKLRKVILNIPTA